jgi:hypothetical protein
MTQYPTCTHMKEDGTYCGSPAPRHRKYCYSHLAHRGRRLRRARALRDQVNYRLDLPPLEDLASVQVALSEVVQAMGSGQLDQRTGGKMLYGIQQTVALMKYRAQLQAAQPDSEAVSQASAPLSGANLGSPSSHAAPVQEYPGFEEEYAINPGGDVDAETIWTLRKADEEAELRHSDGFPAPPPGLRPGSLQYRIYREAAYQDLNTKVNSMNHQLREYYEMKRKEGEKLKKEMMSAIPAPERVAESA